MPELPDLTVYLEALERHVGGRRLGRVEVRGVSVLRSVEPPLREAEGRRVLGLRRLGKRLVLGLEDGLFLVIHLMVAGRLRWRDPGARAGGRDVLAAFRFENGTLLLSEASRRKRATLAEWTGRLRAEVGERFPEKVTAFREGMAVHGRFGEPCPLCGSPVQRIVHAENESNYCATCQTGGRLLADRALSRLLHADWPRTLEELEERLPGRAASRRKEGAR